MQSIKILILSLCFTLLCGCAFHHGGNIVGYEPITPTKKIVERINEKSSPTVHVLGIGGLSKTSLLAEAKNILFNNVKLKEGQTLNNISFEYKTSNFFIVHINRVFISADIMQEVTQSDAITTPKPPIINQLDQQKIVEYLGFKIGEKIYFKKHLFGTIKTGVIAKLHENKVEVIDSMDGSTIFIVRYNLIRKHPDNKK